MQFVLYSLTNRHPLQLLDELRGWACVCLGIIPSCSVLYVLQLLPAGAVEVGLHAITQRCSSPAETVSGCTPAMTLSDL